MQSETISKLSEALAKVQGSLNGAKKDATNPYFKNKYADLESVWDACRAQLSENGLSVVQTTDIVGDNICLVTVLMHSSGEWIRSVMPLFLPKRDSQTLGSAMTYARRYSLAAMIGVVQTDDDGNKASEKEDPAQPKNSFQPLKPLEKKSLGELMQKYPEARAKICARFSVDAVDEIGREEYLKVVKWLEPQGARNG